MLTVISQNARHLEFFKKIFLAQLQETFYWNSVISVDNFSVMFLLQIGLNVRGVFQLKPRFHAGAKPGVLN